MSSSKGMAWMNNHQNVTIWSRLARPQLQSLSPLILPPSWVRPVRNSTSTGIGSQARTSSTCSGGQVKQKQRWHSCCAEALKVGTGNSVRSGCRGFDHHTVKRQQVSDTVLKSTLRTYATSPEGSDSSQELQSTRKSEELGSEKGGVQKYLEKGFLVEAAEELDERLNKPEICTADELHYVTVPGTQWRLALWRYLPPSNTPKRNHPLLLLSGIGTNAIGFDLDPSVSMARSMAGAGFDTWILEVRGAGLSKSEEELAEEGKAAETSKGDVIRNREDDEENKTDLPLSKSEELTGAPGDETAGKKERPNERSIDSMVPEGVACAEVDTPSTGIGGETLSEISLPSKRSRESVDQEENEEYEEGTAPSTKISRTETVVNKEETSSPFSLKALGKGSALSKGILGLRERLSNVLEAPRSSSTTVATQLSDLRRKIAQLLEDGQDAVSPRVSNLQDRVNRTVDDFQRIVDLIAKYDWDFDNYLEEDVPTAMEYIRNQCKPADGKLLSVGHSMGGIVLYALLSTRGTKSGLVGAVTLASALDYQCSDTTLKLLLPLTDPAQLLNVPLVPLGVLMTAVHPLVTKPPYALAWLGYQVSAQNMMKPELFSKLVLNNFGTIPIKLLLQLNTVFQSGGLANRSGTFKYKENIGKVTIPVLAVAGDQDLICPPAAVHDTVQLFPEESVTYKCFGGENDRHYGHYDIVCSTAAKEEIFPAVLDFLTQNDELKLGEDVGKVDVKS